MNKNAIKKFAMEARRELISRVSQRALKYGISEKEVGNPNDDSINGHLLSSTEKKQRAALIAQIKEKGYEQVMEEIAYTWFNRFSALRFMEVNGYLPSRVRVFTDENNAFKPQILAEAIHMELDGLDMEKVYAYKEANDDDELYKYLLITQCNALNKILPGMFQKIADYTELLLPDNLLREGSVIQQMIELIPEEDWKDAVQIIGWLYQYYNDEPKNEIINIYKGTVKKEDIPAATQLFTTDWVVRYMVDNSLGRYWIERHPESTLVDKLEFFTMPNGGEIQHIDEFVNPEDIKFLDPCMGSGHILVYAFDVLMEIYSESGYSERDAVAMIVQNNLFGLDIDERASQLAYFAVMMKARSYDRRFLSRGIKPNVLAIKESNGMGGAVREELTTDAKMNAISQYLVDTFRDAKELGSIITVEPKDYDGYMAYLDSCNGQGQLTMDATEWLQNTRPILKALAHQAKVLAAKYPVVCTNPPYLNKIEGRLKSSVTENYKDYSGDLFSVFTYRNLMFCKQNGYCGYMTPFVWMFIKTYEKLREFILCNKSITTLVQMEYSAFEEATVPICSFVLKNGKATENGLYFKLSDFKGGMEVQKQKVLEALANKKCGYFYEADQFNFSKIPGCPVAYWWRSQIFDLFDGTLLSDYALPKVGLQTGENEKYLRYWYEVNKQKIGFGCANSQSAIDSKARWFPCNKGGEFRRWFGNNYLVVDWEFDGKRIKAQKGSYIRNPQFYFKRGMTWSTISSGKLSMRYSPSGFLFETKGSMCFPLDEKNFSYLLGLLNSNVVQFLLTALSPTLDYHEGPLGKTPTIIGKTSKSDSVDMLVNKSVSAAKSDWDSFEISWDFQRHPLLCKVPTIAEAFDQWKTECDDRFNQLKANEEELNRIFIDSYGLQDELTPEVEDKDVTVRKADLGRDIRSFISYAVGCMFGRYSLDVDGLAYAGGEWDTGKYASFAADKDNIIPICDDEYFEDDIVGLFVKFVKTVYGADTLDENLKFIADALGGKGQPKDVIRNYFLSDFYSDHCKIYQKRPIYWLFDSGKKNGFKALIYMHRYQPDTIARIRTDYVHEQQARYRTAIADLEQRIANASTSERVKLNKQLKTLNDQATEIHAYEEKIHHLADQMISIDLDDGVKKNYAILQDVLAKIK